MQHDDLRMLLARIVALTERFERRCDTASHGLQQMAMHIPGVVQKSADDQLRRLPAEVMGQVRNGIEQQTSAYEQRLRDAGNLVHSGSQAMAEQLQRMERLHRQMVWKVAGITFGSLLLLLVGGIWLSRHYYNEIRENQLSAELLRAYNQADVNLCGDRLCANVETKGPKFGDKKQYLLVEPRH